jgi:hypothetical protein
MADFKVLYTTEQPFLMKDLAAVEDVGLGAEQIEGEVGL